jgi:hypothetical protein
MASEQCDFIRIGGGAGKQKYRRDHDSRYTENSCAPVTLLILPLFGVCSDPILHGNPIAVLIQRLFQPRPRVN